MASEMMDALMALCDEKHIDQLLLLDRLEQTLAKSYADTLECEYGARVTIDRTTGNIYVYELIPVGEPNEEGEYEEFDEVDVTPDDTSRFAAMAVKNEINEIVHLAKRQQICEEFQDRIGDIITGTVLQSTPDFTIVKIREGVEAELPHYSAKKILAAQRRREELDVVLTELPQEINERPKGERYVHNQRVKAVIIGVRDPLNNKQPARGDRQRPSIIVSRTAPELIARLFELEVPEVYDGVVRIKSIARDPGERAKVAVTSLDEKLDPVGACVGPKGSRVRTVVQELHNERVDVVLWDPDPAKFIANALSPAKVSNVIIDNTDDRKYATVIVPNDQLSLTIGKGGQNARLAANLTGYHIDIKDESLAKRVLEELNLTDKVDELLAHETLEVKPQENVVEEAICEYVDEDGVQCQNPAREGSQFCDLHSLDEDMFDDVEVTDDPDSLI